MNISKWGPGLWELIHSITYNYGFIQMTDIKKKQYIYFFISIAYLLPCDGCKKLYIQYIKKNPIKQHIHSYDSLMNWTNKLHNSVNSRLNKKVFSLDESKRNYIDNNSVKINHTKIYYIINLLIKNCNYNNIKYFKIFFNSLNHIFPCEKCRTKLNLFHRTNNIQSLNMNNIFQWSANLNIKALHS